jgi:hypothetical protein
LYIYSEMLAIVQVENSRFRVRVSLESDEILIGSFDDIRKAYDLLLDLKTLIRRLDKSKNYEIVGGFKKFK